MALFKRSNTSAKGFDWAGFGWLFLFFWYFSGITQLLILLTGTSGFSGFRQAFVMSAVWLAPMLLPATRKHARHARQCQQDRASA
jgi:heptose-I-phosphate ethanolaminephosphotransferase